MTIDPTVFGVGIGALFAAVAVAIREYFISRSYTNRAAADGNLMQEKSQSTAVDTLADIARQGLVLQQQGIVTQQSMVEAVRDMTRSNAEASAHIAGMVRMQDDHTRIIRAAVLTIDEMATSLPKLKTDIEGSIATQFAPIVSALSTIGIQLTNLVSTVQAKDGEINARLSALIDDFRNTETRLMKALEPIVLKSIGELTRETSDNHTSAT